jgi:hypothetical protein
MKTNIWQMILCGFIFKLLHVLLYRFCDCTGFKVGMTNFQVILPQKRPKLCHNRHHWTETQPSKLTAYESYTLNKNTAHNSNHIK